MLHTETVEAGTLALLKKILNDKEFQTFNLAGGTALSLQLGHRKSIDLDLFTDKDFDAEKLADHLAKTYNMQSIGHLKNAIFCRVDNIKVDILAHQYRLIDKVPEIEDVRMLSLKDIGAMKLNAILYNGTRLKDFVDMHCLVEHVPLYQLTEAFENKYPDVNKQMAQAGLLYHQDINLKEKVDFIGREITWKEIAGRLRQAVADDHKIFNDHKIKTKKIINVNQSDNQIHRKGRSNRPKL